MDHQKNTNRKPALWILLFLVSFGSVAAVLFTPALPEIAQKLQITSGQAGFTITIFLIGYAIGNLPYGPISNRFGRKPAIYLGILIAILGSILVALVDKFPFFWLLLLGRFLTALGSTTGLTNAFALVGDAYEKEALIKRISYFMLVFAMGPGIAVALGGFLTTYFGWASCFYFLVIYSLFLLGITTLLPETNKELDVKALDPQKIIDGYLLKIRNKKLVVSSLLMGCGVTFVYLFASEAPFIGMNYMGLKPEDYGLLNFIPPIGMITGSILSNFLAEKKRPFLSIKLGIGIAFLFSILLLSLFLLGFKAPWALFLPMPFIYVGISLIFSNSSALAMTHAQNKSNGSAMMNCINLGTCVIILSLLEIFSSHQIFIMPLCFVLLCLLMFFIQKRLSSLLKKDEK